MDALGDVRRLLAARPGRVIVGITGPPGAGKSTLAGAWVREFGTEAAYLPMDGFHLSNAQLERLGRRHRKGAPDTFDVDGYVATLRRVLADYAVRDVYVPDFDRALEEPVAAGLVIPRDARLVVTEGNYLTLLGQVRVLINRHYYVDVPDDVRRSRLVARHVAGGRSEADARAWVDEVDEHNAALVAATRSDCDVFVTGD